MSKKKADAAGDCFTFVDLFAGSGTTGAACLELGRRFTLIDNNPQALEVMAARFADVEGIEWVDWTPLDSVYNKPEK